MNVCKIICILMLFCGITLNAQSEKALSPFALTPEMFASLMAKSLEGNLPQTFKHKELSLTVTKVSAQSNQVFFHATTTQSKQILDELYKHHSLPDDLKKQCKDFSKIAMVDKGVIYLLHVEDKSKSFDVLYDKEACSASFDPAQKIFVGGYNRYGFDIKGHTRAQNAKLKNNSAS